MLTENLATNYYGIPILVREQCLKHNQNYLIVSLIFDVVLSLSYLY